VPCMTWVPLEAVVGLREIILIPILTTGFLKKGMWLYPPDENGNSLMARPATSEEDYRAFKKGILRNLFERRSKADRKEFRQKLDAEVIVSDEIL